MIFVLGFVHEIESIISAIDISEYFFGWRVKCGYLNIDYLSSENTPK